MRTSRSVVAAVLVLLGGAGMTAALQDVTVQLESASACAEERLEVNDTSASSVCGRPLGTSPNGVSGTSTESTSTKEVKAASNLHFVPTATTVDLGSLSNQGTVETLSITTTSATATRPTLELGDTGLNLTGLSALTSVTIGGVNFSSTTPTIELPSATNYLKLDDTNIEDLSLTIPDNATNWMNIEFKNATLSTLPKFFYESNYSRQSMSVRNLNLEVSTTSPVPLSSSQVAALEANYNLFTKEKLSTGNWTSKVTSDSFRGDCANAVASSTIIVVCDNGSTSSADSAGSSTGAGRVAGSSNSSGSSDDANTGDSSGMSTALIVIIVLVVIIAVVLVFFIVRMFLKRRAARAGAHDENAVTLMGKGDTAGDKGSFISNDEFLRDFQLPQSDVSLTKSVGSGRLWVGEYNGGKVVLKRVESEVTASFVTKALMAQARTFATISHPNITNLVGVTWLAGTDFAVVTEFMDKGNLKTVLSNADVELDLSTKLQMCLDVALALAYLHATEQNLCAKQLSSRKVLVNSAMTCKLSLFECIPSSAKLRGSSPASTPYSYGMGEVAWLAPEVITRSAPMDARKSNIYAFGVLVGEIFTRKSPYHTLLETRGNTLSDVELVQRIRRQEPMAPHENRREYLEAPLTLRQAVDRCLSYSPMSRPSAQDLLVALHNAKEELLTNSM